MEFQRRSSFFLENLWTYEPMNTLHLQFDSIILMISWYVNMMLTSCLTMNLGCLVNFHRIPSRFLVVLVFIIYFNVFRSQHASSCLIVPHRASSCPFINRVSSCPLLWFFLINSYGVSSRFMSSHCGVHHARCLANGNEFSNHEGGKFRHENTIFWLVRNLRKIPRKFIK